MSATPSTTPDVVNSAKLLEKCWESATMQWDDEVDLVCVGTGAGVLATAIIAVDDGQAVFVAQSPGVGQRSHRRLAVEVSDRETNAYFDAVTEGAGTPPPDATPVDLPVRFVADAVRVRIACNRRRPMVEPFLGARLVHWAASCVGASHGVLYSHVTGRSMSTMRGANGEKFEAAVVGSVEPGLCRDGWSCDDWLSAQACARDIDTGPDSALDRLVFDDGRVVGVVITTPDGARAVSARGGVVVATAGHSAGAVVTGPMVADAPVQVCVVSQTASRFGRVELLACKQTAARASAWTVSGAARNRQLRSHTLNARGGCRSIAPGRLHDGGV